MEVSSPKNFLNLMATSLFVFELNFPIFIRILNDWVLFVLCFFLLNKKFCFFILMQSYFRYLGDELAYASLNLAH